MSIHVAIRHSTHYTFDRPVSLSPHVVRLKPAAHSRTPIESYSLRIKPEKHFINWQQDPFGNYLARLVFPERTTELLIDVEVIADLTVISDFLERLDLSQAMDGRDALHELRERGRVQGEEREQLVGVVAPPDVHLHLHVLPLLAAEGREVREPLLLEDYLAQPHQRPGPRVQRASRQQHLARPALPQQRSEFRDRRREAGAAARGAPRPPAPCPPGPRSPRGRRR